MKRTIRPASQNAFCFASKWIIQIGPRLLAVIAMTLYFIACTKTTNSLVSPNLPRNPPVVDSVKVPAVSTDTIFVLKRIFNKDQGSSIDFTFDSLHNRYNTISGTGQYSYDSTYINYNSDGTIWYFVRANETGNVGVTVLQYNNKKQITRIIGKLMGRRPENTFAGRTSPDVSDLSTLSYYDSINYDAKNRISSTYRRVYDYYIPLSTITLNRNFFYKADNDSLLDRIDEYALDANKHFSFSGSYIYITYDTMINPFYKVCPIYGLIDNVTGFSSQAQSGLNNYTDDHFLNFGPHNCTNSSENLPVIYTYNSAGLPIYCRYTPVHEVSPNFDRSAMIYTNVVIRK